MAVSEWLEGAEKIVIEGCTGPNTYVGAPWRLVLHTIEGSDMNVAINAVFKPQPCYTPHFTVSLAKRRIVQHIRMTWSAAALANDPGGVETNRENAIQVELEGFAKDAANRTQAEIEFLGEFIAMLIRGGVPLNLDHVATFVGAEAGTIAVKNSKYRFSSADWQTFDGICGHQHVPENEHWDPGKLDVLGAVKHARVILGQDVEDDMDAAQMNKVLADWQPTLVDAVAEKVLNRLGNQDGKQKPAAILADGTAVNLTTCVVLLKQLPAIIAAAIASVPAGASADAALIAETVANEIAERLKA